MQKLCPNECGTELTVVSDSELYCSKCDLTYRLQKGKAVVEPTGGKIKEHEILLSELQKKVADLTKALFGDDDPGQFLPGIY